MIIIHKIITWKGNIILLRTNDSFKRRWSMKTGWRMSSRFFEIPSLLFFPIPGKKSRLGKFKIIHSNFWIILISGISKKNFLPFFTPFFYIYTLGFFFLQKDKYIAQGFLVVNVMKGGMMNKNKSKPSVRLTTTS